MSKQLVLEPDEWVLQICHKSDKMGYGPIRAANGTALIAPDGICRATGGMRLDGPWKCQMNIGSRWVVWLTPAEEHYTFTYFANAVRQIDAEEPELEFAEKAR